jgi:Ca-activated chloride channel family protein
MTIPYGLSFAYAWVLWFIPLVILLFGAWWFWVWRKNNFIHWEVSDTRSLDILKGGKRALMLEYLPTLTALSSVLLLIALARPQTTTSDEKVESEGIDMVISMDVSTSMLAQDFKPNRLEAAKKEAMNFITGRKQDRIGLVIFSGESFTQCPVTINHAIVQNQLKNIKNGILEDGTAIGMGLATAIQRLKDSEAKSKVVILMTDGVNNRGVIDPVTASEIALSFNVRVYTIGVGTNGQAYSPIAMQPDGQLIFGNAEVQIDEALLKEIARKTGGQYFRANNNNKLKEIYKEIDQLEKTKVEVSAVERKHELFYLFAISALFLLLMERLMKYIWLKSIS